jgi:flagellar protein FliL
MPPKPEAAHAAKPEATPAPAAAPAAAAPAPAKAGGIKALLGKLLPVALVVVLAPVSSWVVAKFVILPEFEKKLAVAGEAPAANAATPAPAAEPAAGEKGGKGGKKGEPAAGNVYEFANQIVNLSGTMGTRYLKASFIVTGSDLNLRALFETNKAKLVDITINVLSSLSLADLDEVGARNIIRERLVNAYNQALGKKIAEQVYFSDFVVQ